MALDAVHAWGVRWRFSFCLGLHQIRHFGPLRGRPDCCSARWRFLAPGPAVQVIGRCPFSHPFLAPSRQVSLLPRGSSLSPGKCLVKVSLSPSLLPFSSPTFSRALLLVSSSLLMILLPSSSSTSHSVVGVATFSDGPVLPLLLQYIGNLASVVLCTLPSDTLSRFSGACVLTTPPLALWSLPVCSGSPRLRWVPGHTGARLLSTLSPSRSLPTWVSLLALRPRHSTDGLPRSQSSSAPCPSSQTLCHGF